jgi:SAM-dependent methyltransferase
MIDEPSSTERLLPGGLPAITAYLRVLESPVFGSLERYSDDFIRTHRRVLRPYRHRWVEDPLHQWSRQWEYPHVLAAITRLAEEQGKTRIRVLDAGSGLTFFPFYLSERFSPAQVTCCDSDPSLQHLFTEINRQADSAVRFVHADIANTGLGDESCDLIYCISVLEHSRDHEPILDEFHRVLVAGGRLVVTFDVSIDGRAEISVAQAKALLSALSRRFEPIDPDGSRIDENRLHSDDIITTVRAYETKVGLLPWKYPRLWGFLSDFRKFRVPVFSVKNLTIHCATFEKPLSQ